MAVDLDFITAPPVGTNSWVIEPSNDDTIDSDNFQYVLDQAYAIQTVTPTLRPDVLLAAGTHYHRKQSTRPNWGKEGYPGKIRGVRTGTGEGPGIQGTLETIVVAGTQLGGSMDYVTLDDAIDRHQFLIPYLWMFYGTLDGDGTFLEIEDLWLRTVPSVNDRSGNIYFFGNGDNVNVQGLISVRPIVGDFKIANLTSIAGAAPNMTVNTLYKMFEVGDIGSSLLIESAPTAANNGLWTITAVNSPTQAVITNGAGVAEATNCACYIKPAQLTIGRRDFVATNVRLEADLGGSGVGDVNPDWGIPTSTLDVAAFLKDETQDVVIGGAVPPDGPHFGFYEFDGQQFYSSQGARLGNGVLSMTHCEFVKCGVAAHMSHSIDQVDFLPNLVLAPNATRCVQKFNDCLVTECGADPIFGSSFQLLAEGTGGSYEIDGNEHNNSTLIGSFMGAYLVGPGSAGFALGTSEGSTIAPGFGVVPGPLSASMEITNNETHYQDGEPAHIGWFGATNPVTGGPANYLSDMTIADNEFNGEVGNGITVDGTANILIKNNRFLGSGSGDQRDILLRGCANAEIVDNEFRSDLEIPVEIDANCENCSVTDRLGNRSAGVRDHAFGTKLLRAERASDVSIEKAIMKALSGDLVLVLDPDAEDVTAAELNAGAAGDVTRTFSVRLETANGLLHNWFNGQNGGTPTATTTDLDIDPPEVEGSFQLGEYAATVTFDTDAGATKTYQAGDILEVPVDLSGIASLANVGVVTMTYTVV